MVNNKNILNIWDEEKNEYVGVPTLKGEKGDTGEKGDKGDPGAIKLKAVDALPESGDEDTIYLLPNNDPEVDNTYQEYICIGGKWELLGHTTLETDFVEYVKKTDYANEVSGGAVRINLNGGRGVNIDQNGFLYVQGANDQNVKDRTVGRPLTPKNIDRLIKVGLTTNTETLTENEQSTAKQWLDINDVKLIKPNQDGTPTYLRLIDLEDGVYKFSDELYLQNATKSTAYYMGSSGYLFIHSGMGYNNQYQIKSWCVMFFHKGLSEFHQRFGYENLNNPSQYSCTDKNMNALVEAHNNSTIWGEKTFSKQPKMTDALAADDNSTNIPNTAWVNNLFKSNMGIKPIEPNENSEYSFRIYGQEEGLYYLPAGTVIYPYGMGDYNITRSYSLIISINIKNENTYNWIGFGDTATIDYGYTTNNSWLISSTPLRAVVLASTQETIYGEKTFSKQPKMTDTLAADDNSTNIPNTAWVNAAIKKALEENKA